MIAHIRFGLLVSVLALVKADTDMLACSKKALSQGVPGLLPSYDPAIIDYFADAWPIPDFGNMSYSFTNLSWFNLPGWDHIEVTKLANSTAVKESYSFNLHWTNMSFEGLMTFAASPVDNFTISYLFENITCSGGFDVLLATDKSTAYMTRFDPYWTVEDGDMTGGDTDDGLGQLMINYILNRPSLPELFTITMNTVWLPYPEKLETLKKWCEAN